jgi:cell division topological specificity factor
MAGFLDWVFGRANKPKTSATAKERLQFILVHDRIHLPPEHLEMMKQEILAVISKYVDVDGDNVDIALQKRDRESLLVAEVPFSRRTEGIEPEDDPPELDENDAPLRDNRPTDAP